jgi:hypothetical protein
MASTPAPTPDAIDATAFAELIAKDPENTLLRLPLSFNKTELGMFEEFVAKHYPDSRPAERLCSMIRDVEMRMDLEAFVDSRSDSRAKRDLLSGFMIHLLGWYERSYIYPSPTLRFASEAAQAWLDDLKAVETDS